uniref:RNA polymerase-associated protein n=1 Tax=Caenorhabditis tropicalis TaxID=1561998 RepID=A0A1I7TRY8_9PELO
MSDFDDDNLFDDFDDRMDTEPITLGDSDDSFDDGPQQPSSSVDRKAIIEKYQKLKEESKRLDEIAVEVRSLVMICRQMEECYTKRIGKDLISQGEVRYLHDGTVLLLVTIQNVTNQPMIEWTLSIQPSSIFPSNAHSASICQTINLGTLLPGVRKTFRCHLNCDEPPYVLRLSLIREFQLDDIRKVFQVDTDPISVTAWNQTQKVEKKLSGTNVSFKSSIRLPNSLIDLLSGSPDNIISIAQVYKSILNIPNDQEETIILCIPSSPTENYFVEVNCAKDGIHHHLLTIATESSRSHTLLAQHLRLHLIVEMSKLKSRPAKGILILTEMDAVSVEELFQSMLSAFN